MKAKISLLMGNFLEFYDFTLFAYMIPIISPLLFAGQNDAISSYMLGYLFLAVGFVFRPVGAVVFGLIGDHYGRKTALMISIFLMAMSTSAIGLLPTGVENPYYLFVGLGICRIFQGMSAGGEYSGAGLLLIENNNSDNNFLSGSLLTASALLGCSVAALVAAIMSLLDSSYVNFVWRLLFLVGGAIGFLCFWMRSKIPNDYISEKKLSFQLSSWSMLFKNYSKPIVLTILCSALMNVPFQMITSFLNSFLIATGQFSKPTLMFINAGVVLFCAIVTVLFGSLTTKLQPLKMMRFASLSICLFSIPFFMMVSGKSIILFVIAQMIMILLSQLFVAPAFVVLAQLFPRFIRYRGLAISNCLAIAFFGGGTPYISGWLVSAIGYSWAPVFYLMFVASLGAFAAVKISNMLEMNNSSSQSINSNFNMESIV